MIFGSHTDEDSIINNEAHAWLNRVDGEWSAINASIQPDKKIHNAEFCEMQGGRVHPTEHHIGHSAAKSVALILAGTNLLVQWKPQR